MKRTNLTQTSKVEEEEAAAAAAGSSSLPGNDTLKTLKG